jgi:hypothetical protein
MTISFVALPLHAPAVLMPWVLSLISNYILQSHVDYVFSECIKLLGFIRSST